MGRALAPTRRRGCIGELAESRDWLSLLLEASVSGLGDVVEVPSVQGPAGFMLSDIVPPLPCALSAASSTRRTRWSNLAFCHFIVFPLAWVGEAFRVCWFFQSRHSRPLLQASQVAARPGQFEKK